MPETVKKVSEMIAALQRIQAVHGDLPLINQSEEPIRLTVIDIKGYEAASAAASDAVCVGN